jgi:tetratricopeptide (TPR) repeat protein
MSRVEKTVFISYRRSTAPAWALGVAQNFTHTGFEVFFDYSGIASGDFEQVILENIRTRAHFLILLTPSALERVDEPGDWLRREIEEAIEHRRNIVPLMLEGFDFATPSIRSRLAGTLEPLKQYNGLSVPVEYFEPAMTRLREQFLNVAVETVLHPASAAARSAANTAQRAAAETHPPAGQELSAERWFERGFDTDDDETAILCYTEAIRLKPDFPVAYYNRDAIRHNKGDLIRALADFEEVIRLDPSDKDAYHMRGEIRRSFGDTEGALADFNEAYRIGGERPDD